MSISPVEQVIARGHLIALANRLHAGGNAALIAAQERGNAFLGDEALSFRHGRLFIGLRIAVVELDLCAAHGGDAAAVVDLLNGKLDALLGVFRDRRRRAGIGVKHTHFDHLGGLSESGAAQGEQQGKRQKDGKQFLH